MDNQKLFMELLKDLMEYATANDNSISTAEIDDIFSDIELTAKQLEYVYDYMYSGGITVRGYIENPGINMSKSAYSSNRKADYNDCEENESNKSSKRLKQYRKSVRELETASEDHLEEACRRLLSGMADEADKNVLIEKHLLTVINMVSKYTGKGVSADELIQEGNLALVLGVGELDGSYESEVDKAISAAAICESYLRNKIRSELITHIDSINAAESEMMAAAARVSLVNEAVKTLAKENGRIATITELSQYTHIPVSELRDIILLAGDSIEVAGE